MSIGSVCGAIKAGHKILGSDFSTTDKEGINFRKKGTRPGRRTIGGADFRQGSAGTTASGDVIGAAFDSSSSENAIYELAVPEDYENGDQSILLHWFSTSATTTLRASITVSMAIGGTGDGTQSDWAVTTSIENSNGASKIHATDISLESFTGLTLEGFTGGEIFHITITRNPGDTIDDLNVDFVLVGITFKYLRRG